MRQGCQHRHVLVGRTAAAADDVHQVFVEERPHLTLEHGRCRGVVVVFVRNTRIGEDDDAEIGLFRQTAGERQHHRNVGTAVQTHGKDIVLG